VLRPPIEPGQFRSVKFVRELKGAGLVGSMGRTGACADNAAMESFCAAPEERAQHPTLE